MRESQHEETEEGAERLEDAADICKEAEKSVGFHDCHSLGRGIKLEISCQQDVLCWSGLEQVLDDGAAYWGVEFTLFGCCHGQFAAM